MRNNCNYNGGLTREQFLFYEIRTVSTMICRGMNREDIILQIQHENLFQFPTERMIKPIANTCFKRIDALESEVLVYHLSNAPIEVAKQINLYAIMRQNAIVWDFMTDVIGEKFRTQQFDFSSKDMNVFFIELQEQVTKSANWSESTIKKIKQVLKKILVECEYLDDVKSQKLNLVYMFPKLEEGIRENNDLQALSAFNCFM